MSNGNSNPKGTGNQFYDEAADWFAKMRGPEADAHQIAFDAWLACGALHRAAYNRIAEIFTDSELVGSSEPVDSKCHPQGQARPFVVAMTVLALVVCAALVLFTRVGDNDVETSSRKALASASSPTVFATTIGEIRAFRLSDGSRVTLDTDSLLTTRFTTGERHIRLIRGRARFDVAHEVRPFKVAAGAGTVTARGTLFDVWLGEGKRVSVDLIRGAIDVTLQHSPVGLKHRIRFQRLIPGQGTSYTDRFTSDRPSQQASSTQWPSAMAEFHDVPLQAVIDQANAYALIPIELDNPDIASLKISGIFSLKDSLNLARRIAHLYGLQVRAENHRILLTGGPRHGSM